MNQKIKTELTRLMESDFDHNPQDNEQVYVYLRKTYLNGNVRWRIDKTTEEEISIGSDIEYTRRYKQVIVSGKISKRDSGSGVNRYDIVDCTVIENSSVDKPKEKMKQYLVELWDICFSDKNLPGFERKPVTEDFKITTVWGHQKAGHMALSSVDATENYRLGVDWQVWHRRITEDKVRFLIHELTHILHSHHRKEFFITRAKALANILKSKSKQKSVEKLFGNINWDHVKAKTLDEPHRQSSDIVIGSAKNRLEATNKVVSEMESILEYNYKAGQRLYINPPLREIKVGHKANVNTDDVEMIGINTLDFSNTYSDSVLNEFINSELAAETYGFDYDLEQVPVVDSEGTVIDNQKFVCILNMMGKAKARQSYTDESNTEVKVPCIRKK